MSFVTSALFSRYFFGRPAPHGLGPSLDSIYQCSLCLRFVRASLRDLRPRLRAHSSVFQYVNVLFLQVENNGFEPLTPCLQSRCSSQLS